VPLEGELVRLREIRPGDEPLLASLRNNLATQAWPKALPPDYTEEMVRRRYLDRDYSFDRRDGYFAVEWKADDKTIGYAQYSGVEPRLRAWVGLAMTQAVWGTGASKEVMELLLRFCFEQLGLRVVMLGTHTGVPRMVGLAEKLGFKHAVRLRRSVWLGGEHHDGLVMDMLREEYYDARSELVDRLPDPFGEIVS
jgi:ribosomal-protein-alanine N-acetyltransferase